MPADTNSDTVNLLSDNEVTELEQASDNLRMAEAAYSADRSEWHGRHVARLRFDEVVTFAKVSALCTTVRALRADLKYRYEVIEELRRCRDRWLTMLNPATAEMSVDDAITALREQLAQLTRERSDLQDALRRFKTIQSQPSDII